MVDFTVKFFTLCVTNVELLELNPSTTSLFLVEVYIMLIQLGVCSAETGIPSTL